MDPVVKLDLTLLEATALVLLADVTEGEKLVRIRDPELRAAGESALRKLRDAHGAAQPILEKSPCDLCPEF